MGDEYSLGMNFYSGSVRQRNEWSKYGAAVEVNDIVTVVVDMDKRTLSYRINGVDKGVVKKDLPKEHVWVGLYMAYLKSEVLLL